MPSDNGPVSCAASLNALIQTTVSDIVLLCSLGEAVMIAESNGSRIRVPCHQYLHQQLPQLSNLIARHVDIITMSFRASEIPLQSEDGQIFHS